jgi:hypothetical protein
MITYWLVVMLLIEGNDPVTLEDIKQPNMLSCINEMVKRLEHNENHGLVVDKYHNAKREAYEYSVACNAHKPEFAPL